MPQMRVAPAKSRLLCMQSVRQRAARMTKLLGVLDSSARRTPLLLVEGLATSRARLLGVLGCRALRKLLLLVEKRAMASPLRRYDRLRVVAWRMMLGPLARRHTQTIVH